MIKVKDNHVVLCGLATKDVLNTYQSDGLVRDKRIFQRGSKTGFYGFENLKTLSILDEFKKIALERR